MTLDLALPVTLILLVVVLTLLVTVGVATNVVVSPSAPRFWRAVSVVWLGAITILFFALMGSSLFKILEP